MNMNDKFDFEFAIVQFNGMYKLPVATSPTLIVGVENAADRLRKFKDILLEELNEIDDVIAQLEAANDVGPNADQSSIDSGYAALTGLADLLGDIQVYCASEMAKFGLPLNKTLEIIMESNMSKQFNDGPHYDERGKVMKGPNYWKPEPRINAMLRNAVDFA
jgi:predicted HAD superfamily Cof-like phosphohydrolase